MRALIFALLFLLPVPAFAQAVSLPQGVATAVVPGNITIAVFASISFDNSLQPVEYVGVFEKHSDGLFYHTGLGTTPVNSANMNQAVTAAGGFVAYLQNMATPAVNADILQVYYGAAAPGGLTPPAPGSDPIFFLNYYDAANFALKTVNGQIQFAPK